MEVEESHCRKFRLFYFFLFLSSNFITQSPSQIIHSQNTKPHLHPSKTPLLQSQFQFQFRHFSVWQQHCSQRPGLPTRGSRQPGRGACLCGCRRGAGGGGRSQSGGRCTRRGWKDLVGWWWGLIGLYMMIYIIIHVKNIFCIYNTWYMIHDITYFVHILYIQTFFHYNYGVPNQSRKLQARVKLPRVATRQVRWEHEAGADPWRMGSQWM